jgi:predicted phosphodiesterase
MDEQKTGSGQPNRSNNDYYNMTHSQLLNHLRTETKKSKGELPAYKLADFFSKRLWTWFYYYTSSRFGRSYPYKTYKAPATGIYPIAPDNGKDAVSIAIAADWATDTTESFQVAARMKEHNPDYTIHLGDTYYVGAPHEIEINFIKPGSPWVRGSKGSFAVLGNHEMYARGIAFFKKLLPTLGIKNKDGKYDGQKAGFFCLENEYWRILGLDTGYHSVGWPLLELLPYFTPDARMDKLLIDWLTDVVKLNDPNDKRGLLLLSHNQYITAFHNEDEYFAPANQLAKLIGKNRPVVWLWGHEHKFSMYEKAQVNEGITCYGRCIGHGGMPVEVSTAEFARNNKTHGNTKLLMVDDRVRPNTNAFPLGLNGYVVVTLNNEQLEIGYFDVNEKLFSETWTADIEAGTVKGAIDVPASTKLKTVDGKPWDAAVK